MQNFTRGEKKEERAESSLIERERYLSAIVSVQQKLLVSHNLQEVYDEVLAILGKVSGASCVYFFENHKDPDGRLLTSQKAEWRADGINPEIDSSFLQNLSHSEFALNWIESPSQAKIINSLVKDFPQPEREILESQGILSVLALPIIVGGDFFGFLGFGNCVEEKVWDESQAELLQAAAQAFSLAYERTQAEKSLFEREELFREVYDNAEDLIYTLNSEGRFTSINKTCERVTGYTVEEALNLTHSDIMPPEYAELALKMMALKLEGRADATIYETVLITKDGKHIPMEVNSRILYRDGKPCGVMGISRNISERKRTEQKLQSAQERFVKAFNLSPLSIAITRISDGMILDVNETALRSHGFKREEVVGHTTLELNVWADPKEHSDILTLLSQQGYLRDHEMAFQGKSGNKHILLVSAERLTIDGDECVLWSANDITDKKRAEEDLRESEERYRTIAETATDSIITIDEAGQIVFANSSTEKIFGYSTEELIGKPITMLIPEHLYEAHNQGFNNYLTTEIRRTLWNALDFTGLHKSGLEIPIEVSFGETAKGGKRYFTGIIRDITERKQAEQALHESEERLRQAQKLEAIGRLAGGIAHDFNNILTSIIGYSDISLRRIPKNDPLCRNLEEIRKAADRAANLTHQLLAYSRKQILQPSFLDLNEIIVDLEKMLHRLIGEDVMLDIRLVGHLGTIKADKGQIEQVLMNLVVNARDAMPKGGEVSIRTANVEIHEPINFKTFSIPPDKYVLLQVSDTGHGMSEEVKAQLFEPFFTTKEVGKGTGLGLATVYGIIKQSGGYITVDSETDKGTTFNIYFPLSDKEKKAFEIDSVSTEPKRGVETILLAEDDESVRKMTQEILESAGYKVLVSTDCDDAMDICKCYENPIHLLLTDVVMPKLNGRELAERLLLMRPRMKVLYMSGYTNEEIVSHGVSDKGVALIQKPYTINALARKVRELLDLYDRN
jgi:PAS domain S-box-containing protein